MNILDEVNEMTFIDGVRDISFTKEIVKFSTFQAIVKPKSKIEAEVCLVINHKIVMTHATAIEFAVQLDALLLQIKSKSEDKEEAKN